MKKIAMLGLVLAGSLSIYATEASALVCAKGVYRAGCVGPNGAIAGPRAYVHPYRSGTIVRHHGGPVRGRTVIRHY